MHLIMTKPNIKLIIDNTIDPKEKLLLKRQNKLVKEKILLQKESKTILNLISLYGKEILKIEDKLNIINRRKENANRNFKNHTDLRPRRRKVTNTDGDVV